MPPATPNLLLIDPLTLLGREVLGLLPRFPELGADLQLVHTMDDEHQVAEVQGDPVLVSPLDDAQQLVGASAVIVASDAETSRLEHLEALLDGYSEVPVVDLSRLDCLWSRFEPVAPSMIDAGTRHVRVPHPALVVAAEVAGPLGELGPSALSVFAMDPVSCSGQDAVEDLARQGAARLRGEKVEGLIDAEVLAFTLVAKDDELVTDDAAHLFAGLPNTMARVASGHFHGHLVHIGLTFPQPVDEWELRDAWQSNPVLTQADLPLRLDQVVDSEHVIMAPPQIGGQGLTVAVVAMVDGLLVGGALTALEVLRRMLES